YRCSCRTDAFAYHVETLHAAGTGTNPVSYAATAEPAHRRESSPPDVLVLGTAEWDAPIATNQHYVTRELARAADVMFVESLGLRRPTLRRDDLTRMASRVRRAFAGQPTLARRPRPERTRVISPLVVPLHRAPTRPINRALLRRATSAWLTSTSPRILW